MHQSRRTTGDLNCQPSGVKTGGIIEKNDSSMSQ
jgi:hypothetical protein